MTTTHISFKDIEEAVSIAAYKFKKKFPWTELKELRQEGWIGVLSANNYKPANGGRLKYLYGAACNQIKNFITKNKTPVSGGYYRILDELADLRFHEVNEATLVSYNDPETQVLNKERQEALELMLYSALGSNAKSIISIISKEQSTKQVADETGQTVSSLYAIARQARVLLSSHPNLFILHHKNSYIKHKKSYPSTISPEELEQGTKIGSCADWRYAGVNPRHTHSQPRSEHTPEGTTRAHT